MNEAYFGEVLHKIYGTFGKNYPPTHIVQAVFRRVCELPDMFMDFALQKLENEVSLPLNLGRYLRIELWPEFLEKNPHLKSIHQECGCPQCSPRTPGFFYAYNPETLQSCLCKCVCNNDPRFVRFPARTHREVINAGYVLEDPIDKWLANHSSARIFNRDRYMKTIGNTEEPRRDGVLP